jgi:hypothetical protein
MPFQTKRRKKMIEEMDGFLKPKNGSESKAVITRSIYRTKAKRYLSLGMCARHFGVSENTIKSHIENKKPFNGYIITYDEGKKNERKNK